MNDSKFLWLAIGVLACVSVWQLTTSNKAEPAISVDAAPLLSESPTLQSDKVLDRIAVLEDELTREILLRQQLERRLSELENQPAETAQKSTSNPSNQEKALSEAQTTQTAGNEFEPLKGSLRDRLIATGLPQDTVSALAQRVESDQLSLLELRNRAVREGWNDTPEYVEKVHELQDGKQGLRDEFGDDVYDQYLYANGSPNRIRVREVFNGSAAEIAGIQPGDVILSYASGRLFAMTELRNATTQGNVGESVLLNVMRDGETLTLSIPRGAMGISMEPARIEPTS